MTAVRGADPWTGIALKVGSVLGFTVMAACIKAGAAVAPVGQVCFFRSFFAMLPVLAFLAWKGELATAAQTKNPLGHLSRGSLGLIAMLFNFTALAYLPLPDAIALGYAMPLFLTILAALLLGEVVRSFRWVAVLIGLCGVLVILWPRLSFLKGGSGSPDETFGAICALTGALVVAFASIVLTKLIAAERTTTVVFYFSLYGTLGGLLTLPFGWVMLDAWTFFVLSAGGAIGGVSQLMLTQCYRYADASTVAPFEYTSMLFGIVLGLLLFGDVPTAAMLIGSTIVVASGLIVIWREHMLSIRRSSDPVWPWAMIGVDKHDSR